MEMLARISRGMAAVSNWVIGWLLLATVVANVIQVFTRYVMNDPVFWTEEAIRYITVWFTFIGIAAVSQADEHMDMNMFNEIRSPTFQAAHKLLMHVLALVFGAIVLWQGWRYTMLNGSQTSPAAGVRMVYIYSALPVGGAALIIVSLHKLTEALAALFGRRSGQ